MLSKHGLDVLDFDLDMLVEVLAVVDCQIALVENQIAQSEDPDAFGLFNRMEGVVGLAFAACQQYLNSTYPQLARQGQKRWEMLDAPPRHSCGKALAAIADAAANYWKHHGEWPDRHEARTREVIDALTSSRADYVLGNLLFALARPTRPRFSALVHEFKVWRDLQMWSSV